MTLWIVCSIAALILFWAAAAYNALIRDQNRIKEASGGIDIQLKRRHDLIPKLVDVGSIITSN